MADSTRMSSALQIGTTALITLSTGVMLYVAGTTQTQKVQFVNLPPALSGSGTSSTQLDYVKFARGTLTATGGLQKYVTFGWNNPETYTGSIRRFCLEITTAASPTTNLDCGIVAEGATGSGEGLFDGEALTAGLHCTVPGTTEISIGDAQRIKCASNTGTGQNLVGETFIEYQETIID